MPGLFSVGPSLAAVRSGVSLCRRLSGGVLIGPGSAVSLRLLRLSALGTGHSPLHRPRNNRIRKAKGPQRVDVTDLGGRPGGLRRVQSDSAMDAKMTSVPGTTSGVGLRCSTMSIVRWRMGSSQASSGSAVPSLSRLHRGGGLDEMTQWSVRAGDPLKLLAGVGGEFFDVHGSALCPVLVVAVIAETSVQGLLGLGEPFCPDRSEDAD
jgi:hypothetical protein